MLVSESLSREISSAEQKQAIKEIEIYGFSSIKNYLKPATVEKLLALINETYLNINLKDKVEYAGTPSRDKACTTCRTWIVFFWTSW